jgi:dinuclear metal center YbgI/SA1388 family protein
MARKATKRAAGSAARARAGSAAVTVADVRRVLETIAPTSLAAEWDNVGLLAGRPEWPARRGLIALDLTDPVAEEALQRRAEALILYHPPIFKGIRKITDEADGPTRRLPDLFAARVSIFALHTALDAAPGGTNDALLDCFEPAARWPLQAIDRTGAMFKLVVFVPAAEVDALRTALSAEGAGVIGHYTECSFALDGRGSFRGDETTNPKIGRRQQLETVDETRLEMVVPKSRLPGVVRALYANHSYEEPAFDLYPLHTLAGRAEAGMGRVGQLATPLTGNALVRRLARRYDLRVATSVGELGRKFARVVTAAGSFGVDAFRDPEALYITGEIKHHDALTLQKRGVTAILLGHAESERPALARVATALTRDLPSGEFELARADRGPFSPLAGVARGAMERR